MTRTSFISTVAILASLAVGGIAVRSWLEAHDARLQMQATLNGQQQLIAAAQQREQQRARELKDTLAQIAELKRQVQTPQQIIRELPQYLPLPQPLQLVPPGSEQARPAAGTSARQGSGAAAAAHAPASLPNAPQHQLPKGNPNGSALGGASAPPVSHPNATPLSEASLPTLDGSNPLAQAGVNSPLVSGMNVPGQNVRNAAPVVQFPVEDLKPLYDFVQDCRACKAQLDAARADLTDERARSAALAKERDAAIKAARGSFWSRLGHDIKWLALGTGIGLVLARTAR